MKLAILIIGVQNSGKTSTIRHLLKAYNGKSPKTMRAGWNNIYLNPIFKALRLTFFSIPASPTETKIKLATRLGTMVPEVLVVAEQAGGAYYTDTINFLTTNGYHVLRYDILNTTGTSDWERFNTVNMTAKLDNRANEIVTDIKKFLKRTGII